MKRRSLSLKEKLDIDYAIMKDEPPDITETSTPDAVNLYEKCERFKERKRTCYMELYLNPGVC